MKSRNKCIPVILKYVYWNINHSKKKNYCRIFFSFIFLQTLKTLQILSCHGIKAYYCVRLINGHLLQNVDIYLMVDVYHNQSAHSHVFFSFI